MSDYHLPATAEDKVQINELIARYAWAFDTGDVEAFVGCFTSDGILCEDVFEEVDRWAGQDEIRSMANFFLTLPGFPGRQHMSSQVLIEGTTDRCRVRAFCFVVEARPGQPCTIPFTGYYDDVAVKVGGRWLFKERTIRYWSGPILARFPGQPGVKVPLKRPTH